MLVESPLTHLIISRLLFQSLRVYVFPRAKYFFLSETKILFYMENRLTLNIQILPKFIVEAGGSDYSIFAFFRTRYVYCKIWKHIYRHPLNVKGIQVVRIDFFFFILKVANIRCFILIKCSEQEVRFKKICYNVVISEKNSNVCW
jgi:hypothetical protein